MWIEQAGFLSETNSDFLILLKNNRGDPNSFDRAIGSTHPVEKLEVFFKMRGSSFSIEKGLKLTVSLIPALKPWSYHTAAAYRSLVLA